MFAHLSQGSSFFQEAKDGEEAGGSQASTASSKARGSRAFSRFRNAPYWSGRRVDPKKCQKPTGCLCNHWEIGL